VVGLFLFGLALGIGSSVVPGPCGLAVLAAAQTHGKARAVATAIGAALGDAIYVSLGVAGAGRVFAAHPQIVPIIQGISGVMVIAYAAYMLTRKRVATGAAKPVRPGGAWRGTAVGLGLSLANPAVLVTWVILVGGVLGTEPTAGQVAAICGISLGTAVWFGGVGLLAERGLVARQALLHQITRVVCVLLIVYGGSLLGRGLGLLG
jgi:threonine/homoserine/homoserine lactone efflux protein